MESVTNALRLSFARLSVAAAVRLVLAAALFLAGCAIEDTRGGFVEEGTGPPTAYSRPPGWHRDDLVKPRVVPTPTRAAPKSAQKAMQPK